MRDTELEDRLLEVFKADHRYRETISEMPGIQDLVDNLSKPEKLGNKLLELHNDPEIPKKWIGFLHEKGIPCNYAPIKNGEPNPNPDISLIFGIDYRGKGNAPTKDELERSGMYAKYFELFCTATFEDGRFTGLNISTPEVTIFIVLAANPPQLYVATTITKRGEDERCVSNTYYIDMGTGKLSEIPG